MVICYGDLDSYAIIPQLESIRSLQLELYPISVERFMYVLPAMFPQLEQLKVECYDQNTMKQLESHLQKADPKPFPKLVQHRVFYQRNLSQYFSSHGFSSQYRAYMHEHMGTLADLL